MNYQRLVPLAVLSFGLLIGSCRVHRLEPKKAADPDPIPVPAQDITAIGKGQSIRGIATEDLMGVWELKTIQRKVESIDVPSRLNTHVYLVLKDDASAQWFRDDLDLVGYCDSDLMSVGMDGNKERLFFNYSYIKLNEMTGELEGEAHVEQISFSPELSADKKQLTLTAGQVPMTVAVLPEIATKFDRLEQVNVLFERASFDIQKAKPTVLYQAVCEKKNKIFLGMHGGVVQKPKPPADDDQVPTPPVPEPTIPDPVKDESDDVDAELRTLQPVSYQVIQGKPGLFDRFDQDKDLEHITAIEAGKSIYLKVLPNNKKNVIVEVDFELDGQEFDAIRLKTSMKSDSSGQFLPGRLLRILTNDAANPSKELDQIRGGDQGLTDKDVYYTTTLRKNLDRYTIEDTVTGRHLLRFSIEFDYTALASCRVLGLIPCWERPALLLDYIGVELIRFPENKVEPKCSLDDIKGPWEFIRQKKTEDGPWLVIANGDLNTPKKIAIETRADWLENGNLVRQTYGLGKDLSLNVQGWTRCPDLRYNYTFDPLTCQATFTNTKSGAVEVLRMEVNKTLTPWTMSAYRVSGDSEYVNEYTRRESLDLPFVLLNVNCKE